MLEYSTEEEPQVRRITYYLNLNYDPRENLFVARLCNATRALVIKEHNKIPVLNKSYGQVHFHGNAIGITFSKREYRRINFWKKKIPDMIANLLRKKVNGVRILGKQEKMIQYKFIH